MTASFDIRDSAFGIRAIRRASIEADRQMSSDELRTPNCVSLTSTFEVHVSIFAALPGQLFYGTQLPGCLWFLLENENASEIHAVFNTAQISNRSAMDKAPSIFQLN